MKNQLEEKKRRHAIQFNRQKLINDNQKMKLLQIEEKELLQNAFNNVEKSQFDRKKELWRSVMS